MASSRQLTRISDEKYFLNSSLKGDEKVRFRCLCCFVDNEASDISFDFVDESLVSWAGECAEYDLGLSDVPGLDLGKGFSGDDSFGGSKMKEHGL